MRVAKEAREREEREALAALAEVEVGVGAAMTLMQLSHVQLPPHLQVRDCPHPHPRTGTSPRCAQRNCRTRLLQLFF